MRGSLTEIDLINLKVKLQVLITELRNTNGPTIAEQKKIAAAIQLPELVDRRIGAYLAGDRRLTPQNIFQGMIGDCTRGFAEIGADATETPGEIADIIKEILASASRASRTNSDLRLNR